MGGTGQAVLGRSPLRLVVTEFQFALGMVQVPSVASTTITTVGIVSFADGNICGDDGTIGTVCFQAFLVHTYRRRQNHQLVLLLPREQRRTRGTKWKSSCQNWPRRLGSCEKWLDETKTTPKNGREGILDMIRALEALKASEASFF